MSYKLKSKSRFIKYPKNYQSLYKTKHNRARARIREIMFYLFEEYKQKETDYLEQKSNNLDGEFKLINLQLNDLKRTYKMDICFEEKFNESMILYMFEIDGKYHFKNKNAIQKTELKKRFIIDIVIPDCLKKETNFFGNIRYDFVVFCSFRVEELLGINKLNNKQIIQRIQNDDNKYKLFRQRVVLNNVD